MDVESFVIVAFVLVSLVIILILLGIFVSIRNKKRENTSKIELKPSENVKKEIVVEGIEQKIETFPEVTVSEKVDPVTTTNTVEQKMVTSSAIATTSPLSAVSIIIIVLLVIMGLFWLILGFLQLGLSAISFSTINLDPELRNLLDIDQSYFFNSGINMAIWGIWNVFASIIDLFIIKNVVKRERVAVRNLTFLGIAGSLWGGFQLLSGILLQACAIPLYIILAVLVQINKQEYTN